MDEFTRNRARSTPENWNSGEKLDELSRIFYNELKIWIQVSKFSLLFTNTLLNRDLDFIFIVYWISRFIGVCGSSLKLWWLRRRS